MMGTTNKVILIGRLGADPELRYTKQGRPVCKMSLATSRYIKDSDGSRQEKTNWHRVVAWDKQGEICKEFLAKGRQVYVEGRIENHSYIDKEGIKRFSTEIISNQVVFLDSMSGKSQFESTERAQQMADPVSFGSQPSEDLPF